MSQIDINKGLGGNQLLEIGTHEAEEPTNEISKFFFIGSPQLRTYWVVSSASIEFASLVNNIKVGVPVKSKKIMQLEIRLLYDNTPVIVNIIKHEFKETPEETTIEKKSYILEPFYSLTIPGGHSLNLSLTLKVVGSFGVKNKLIWELINPLLTVIIDQQYASKSLSRSNA